MKNKLNNWSRYKFPSSVGMVPFNWLFFSDLFCIF